MTPERKKALAERRRRHALDKRQAKIIEELGIYVDPMDLPSLHRAVYGDGKPQWLSTGFDWIDKPHRVAWAAMKEVRALRAYILQLLDNEVTKHTPHPRSPKNAMKVFRYLRKYETIQKRLRVPRS